MKHNESHVQNIQTEREISPKKTYYERRHDEIFPFHRLIVEMGKYCWRLQS